MLSRSSTRLLAAGRQFSTAEKSVVLVDGCRIPFKTSGSDYNDYKAYDLGRMALKGLLAKTALPATEVEYLTFGTVVQEVRTSNLAREASLGAGFPVTLPCHTVTQACISSNEAIATASEKILSGRADVVIAGGAETFSDVPIRYSRNIRKRLLKANKAMKGGVPGVLKLLKGLKAIDFAPEPPAIANFATGEVMGHSSDRLAARFGVSRQAQDEFALASHKNAAKAHADGVYAHEIIPVDGSTEENGIRGESTIEKLSSMKPAFIKPHGTVTAANASFLTDGAAATLLMSNTRAKELGYTPKAYIRDWTTIALDPFEDMLLGPAVAISKLMKKAGLTLADISVFEIHEAFAGQVLSNLTALDSQDFATEYKLGDKMGAVDTTKLNLWGGSLSLGHPFGATGARLTTTAANRLIAEDGKFALIAACADSGLAHACLLERF